MKLDKQSNPPPIPQIWQSESEAIKAIESFGPHRHWPEVLRTPLDCIMARALLAKEVVISSRKLTFLDLRVPASFHRESGMSDREYQHQWLVRGHIRNQWFPSKQSHLPVWIPPYIKGPDGAPMLTNVARVIR